MSDAVDAAAYALTALGNHRRALSGPAAAVAALDAQRTKRTLPRERAFYDALAEGLVHHGRVNLSLREQRVEFQTVPGSPAWHARQAHQAGLALARRLAAPPTRLALPPGPIGRTQMLTALIDELDA